MGSTIAWRRAHYQYRWHRVVNVWQDPRIKPVEGNVDPFLRFSTMFPDEAERHVVMKWCATLFARPMNRMEFALLITTKLQGIGKTTLSVIARKIVGIHNCHLCDAESAINNNFNDWLVFKRLIAFNETYMGDNERAYRKIETWITDEAIDVQIKYEPSRNFSNFAHFIMLSNSDKPLAFKEGDRRIYMPQVVTEKLEWMTKATFVETYAWLAEPEH